MPPLPVISGAEAVRAFERAGWRQERQRGSHVVMIKPGHIASLSIPQHRELAAERIGVRHPGGEKLWPGDETSVSDTSARS